MNTFQIIYREDGYPVGGSISIVPAQSLQLIIDSIKRAEDAVLAAEAAALAAAEAAAMLRIVTPVVSGDLTAPATPIFTLTGDNLEGISSVRWEMAFGGLPLAIATEPGINGDWETQPDEPLEAGPYEINVRVRYDDGWQSTFWLTFTVEE